MSSINQCFKNRQFQKGMTFIEVLVAFVIIITGVLGAVAMQASAKKGSFDAMQRSVASALAQDIIERMRSNSSATDILESYEGVYGAELNSVPSLRCNSAATLCTDTQMVTNDLYEWELKLMGSDVLNNGISAGGLVSAVGCIAHSNNTINVVISWQGRVEIADGYQASLYSNEGGTAANACGANSTKRRQVVVEAFVY